MKKVIAAIISLSLLLTLSGCKFKIAYWNGMSKKQVHEGILNKLEEKYGEEFVILGDYPTVSGEYYGVVCSPKSDDDLVFEVEWWRGGSFYEAYIRSIVRREMKEIIDSVLSNYCYAYDGIRNELRLSTIVDSSGAHDPDYDSTDERLN